jgi:hypothetical protein
MKYTLFWLRQSGRLNMPEKLGDFANIHALLRWQENWRQHQGAAVNNLLSDDCFIVELTLGDGTTRRMDLAEAKLSAATQLDNSLENILQSLSDVRSGGRRHGGALGGGP